MTQAVHRIHALRTSTGNVFCTHREPEMGDTSALCEPLERVALCSSFCDLPGEILDRIWSEATEDKPYHELRELGQLVLPAHRLIW